MYSWFKSGWQLRWTISILLWNHYTKISVRNWRVLPSQRRGMIFTLGKIIKKDKSYIWYLLWWPNLLLRFMKIFQCFFLFHFSGGKRKRKRKKKPGNVWRKEVVADKDRIETWRRIMWTKRNNFSRPQILRASAYQNKQSYVKLNIITNRLRDQRY